MQSARVSIHPYAWYVMCTAYCVFMLSIQLEFEGKYNLLKSIHFVAKTISDKFQNCFKLLSLMVMKYERSHRVTDGDGKMANMIKRRLIHLKC